MSQNLTTFSGDRRLVLTNGEAIRMPIYMAYTENVGAAAAATDLITLIAHGAINGDKILVRGATPPGGLTAGNYYFVRDAAADTFKVSATAGGAAIDLTTDGTAWTWIKQTWNTIRIGLRGSMANASANITGVPRLAYGLCKGTANGIGSVATDHAIGVRYGVSTWTYNAGPTAYYSGLVTTANSQFFKVGTAYTESFGFNGNGFFSAATAVRNGLFLQITKANPATGFTMAAYGPSVSTAAQSDLTDAEFLAIMELSTLADIATVKANYAAHISGTNLGINENTNGVLDNLFIYWDRSTPGFSFDIKHRNVT